MARRRFFVPQVRDARAEIAGDEARHLSQVLRVERGQIYEISDNDASTWPRSSLYGNPWCSFECWSACPIRLPSSR